MSKEFFFSFLLNFYLLTLVFAQDTTNEKPYSLQFNYKKSTLSVNKIHYSIENKQSLINEDNVFPQPLRYAKSFLLNRALRDLSTIDTLKIGYLLRLSINTPDAFAIGLIFRDFELKPKEKLFLYNQGYSTTRGAYTYENNPKNDTLALPDFPGSHVIIEVFTPNSPDSFHLILDRVNYAYKDINSILHEKSDSYIDINCVEGDPYHQQKHAIAKMTFTQDGGSYLCSGALINNTTQDGTPYFLTANHCISSGAVASTLITYFNYEKEDCNGSLGSFKTISGATLKAKNQKSDFTLLRLNLTPNNTFQPYYAGWRVDTLPSPMSYGIHHPGGDPKKISIDNDATYSFPYEISWEGGTTNPPYSHWLVSFDEGTTSGGSSGSPLFDNEGRIIGQLHGGGDDYDFYGGLFYSWNKGTLNSTKLQPWLDPGNTGITQLDGYAPAAKPDAHFRAEPRVVCTGALTHMVDMSVFSPTSWSWSFTPNTVTYQGGTSSTSQNPQVTFNSSGTYSITLQATNALGTTTQTRTDYVVAGNSINLSYNMPGNKCVNDIIEFKISMKGASSFTWSKNEAQNGDKINLSATTGDEVTVTLNKGIIDKTFSTPIEITGTHGTCTDNIIIDLLFIYQDNDDIENAKELIYGYNGQFSNACATVQVNEPNPPSTSCTNQSAWCACDVSSNILDNSVWFKFTAPASGEVGIYTAGFDNQIALYEADSEADILSGNNSNYTIIAANDDYPGRDDYSATIEVASVTPGETYWLQMDGSACGDTSTCSLYLFDHKVSGTEDPSIYLSGLIYPNPIKDNVFITNEKNDIKNIVVLSPEGKKLFQSSSIPETYRFSFNLSNLKPGAYYLVIIKNTGEKRTQKVIKL